MSDSSYSFSDDDDLAAQYVGWTRDAVASLRTLSDKLKALDTPDTALLEEIYDITHNIKGMGSSFDFQLMTMVGTSLCNYLKHRASDATVSLAAVEAHIRTFEVVMEHGITGDGAEKGKAIMARLETLIRNEPSA